MIFLASLVNNLTGILIIIIVLANVYQLRIRPRFSGAIGKVIFWYTLGLTAMLALTLFNVAAVVFN